MGPIRKRTKWRVVAALLLGGAIATEARKPPAERTGHGRVGGLVPYDFRPPTFQKMKDSVWNPDDERLFVPSVYGAGWSINLARLLELYRAARV